MTSALAYPFDHFGTTEAGECWLSEVTADFTAYDAVKVAASLEGVFRGAAAVFRIRIGGTSKTVDGLAALTIPRGASSFWAEDLAYLTRIVLRGRVLFKLTVQATTQDSFAECNAGTLTIWAQEVPPPLVFRMPGVDIWLGDTNGSGAPETVVTPARDWLLATQEEAYKQSLRRRFVTSPGEYKLKGAGYGAGLREAVKRRGRQCDLDEIKTTLRAQAMKDKRTRRVVSVDTSWFGATGIKYSIVVEPIFSSSPLTISDEIAGGS
jgi:hypothetical protein